MLHFIAIWHKVQHTIIRKLDYIAAGGIINMVNMVNTAVNNNIYAGRKSGSKYNQIKRLFNKRKMLVDNRMLQQLTNMQMFKKFMRH